ncbi:MAG: glycerol kinase GlpK [Gammaproteobacteria bacterium]|nr:glycerol kinase GlpK [Gammaproteobacteria bacterium]MBU2056501.1 glycerol kinase GlpK [Gammaproteobacteria bacterium]MBU2174236.1 glycerol kinase GlpK [Gammaproteobacteria bacterium]MBU2248713.1 glycerol kinase GlpK [Gammaproteobacteria bacterium]MBU2344649.1 glycerol kinase GlpK [Gammaproteobacteria bacterium]
MRQQAILSIDQGTSSSRALLFNRDGKVLAVAQQELDCVYPQQGWVEQDAELIWLSVLKVCRQVLAQAVQLGIEVLGVSISNQRETTVLWHKAKDKVLAPAIVWQDRRTADYCQQLKDQGHEAMVQQKTGLLLDPYFSASKIQWLLTHNADVQQALAEGELAFGTIDSFLLWRLTSTKVHATDTTNASRTLLLNLQTLSWDQELLQLFGVPEHILPQVKQSADSYGLCDTRLFGLALPVLALVGDQQAAALGQGCINAGSLKSTYGTGCFALLNTGCKPLFSKHRLLTTVAFTVQGHTFYALEGAIFVAGAAVKWLRDQLGVISEASETEGLAQSLPDNGGVYLVPAFTGLAAPHWQPEARAALVGMTLGTGKAHLARAALEAVVYQTGDLLSAMLADGANAEQLQIDGGMVANNWLCQHLADVLNIPVLKPNQNEASAYGASVLAAVQLGWFESLADVQFSSDALQFLPQMSADKRQQLLSGWKLALNSVLL